MQTDKGHIEIAKSLMKEIQYDNGAVNRWNDEIYPEKWVNKIAIAARGANPVIFAIRSFFKLPELCSFLTYSLTPKAIVDITNKIISASIIFIFFPPFLNLT